MYLHRLFTRLGYRITIHPDVPDSTGQPDFDLSRGDERFYVEAAVVFSGIVNEGRDEVREGWVMDAGQPWHESKLPCRDRVRAGR